MVTRKDDVNPILMVSAAALIAADGYVLLQERPVGGTLAGLWEFPGGKVEPGETPVAALVRELEEELGIVVAAADAHPLTFVTHALDNRELLLLLFKVEGWHGEPVARHAAALSWVLPDDMKADTMPPADWPLVIALRERARARSA